MLTGIIAGITWALETVILGIALGMSPFVSTEQAIFLAPFISTFLHDACSGLFMIAYNVIRGKAKELLGVFKSSSLKWLVLASAIGGPIGMTGYALAVNYMGPSVGAVASAVYPAIGTVLAYVFLKESVKWYQWIFLVFTLLGVYGLSYSPNLQVENFWLGLLGAFMCAFGWGIEAVILAKCLKDPTIKNTGSDPAWIAAKVIVTDGSGDINKLYGFENSEYIDILEMFSGGLFNQTMHVGVWKSFESAYYNDHFAMVQVPDTANGVYEFYIFVLDQCEKDEEVELFDTMTISGEFTNSDMQELRELEITVQAFAVQAFGFENVYFAMTGAFPEHFEKLN